MPESLAQFTRHHDAPQRLASMPVDEAKYREYHMLKREAYYLLARAEEKLLGIEEPKPRNRRVVVGD